MNPALWGSLCAVNLGFADFMARFSSRAIGPASALFGMLATGAVVLCVYVYVFQPPLVWTWSGIGFVALNGIATTLMTLLLYLGLARELTRLGLPVVCWNARRAADALKSRRVKSDKADALALAEMLRTGWYSAVYVKSHDSHRLKTLWCG